MRIKELKETYELGDVQASYNKDTLVMKGPKGEISRKLFSPKITVDIKDKKITFTSINANRKDKAVIGTFLAHTKNMVTGVKDGFVYKLRICSSHFPMNVSLQNNVFSVKNFLGEKVPRTIKLKTGAKVKIDGTEITVEALDKELAGQVAADLEQLTRVTNRDRRIFQDGIFIIEKAGKVM